MSGRTQSVVAHYVPMWLELTENWIFSQINGMARWSPHVFCRQENGLFAAASIPRWCACANSSGVVRSAHLLERLHVDIQSRLFANPIRKSNALLLHSHFGTHAYRNMGLARHLRLPHVVSVYGNEVTAVPLNFPHWRRRYAKMFQGVEAVLCEGSVMAERIVALGCPRKNVRVIPIGISFDDLPDPDHSPIAPHGFRLAIDQCFDRNFLRGRR